VHVHLAPGESLSPGTREALDALFDDPRVGAVLLPLLPMGEGAFPRAARRYLAAWDVRFLHRQNFFAPASRVASRAALPGPRNADAAPTLAALLDVGGRIEALHEGGVSTPIARDLGAWTAWAREEGRAWGALAARDARFRGFLPATTRPAWWRHNVAGAGHRLVEIHQAVKAPAPLAWLLHASREAAWTAGCVAGARAG
jgi:hypothetical protein